MIGGITWFWFAVFKFNLPLIFAWLREIFYFFARLLALIFKFQEVKLSSSLAYVMQNFIICLFISRFTRTLSLGSLWLTVSYRRPPEENVFILFWMAFVFVCDWSPSAFLFHFLRNNEGSSFCTFWDAGQRSVKLGMANVTIGETQMNLMRGLSMGDYKIN